MSCHDRSVLTVRRPIPLYLVSFVVTGVALTLIGPSLDELRDRTGASISGIGSLFIALQLGFVAGAIAGGRLLDRFNGHRVYALGFGIVAVSMASIPLLNSVLSLLIAMALIGAATAMSDVAANTLLMWHLGADVGRTMNVLHLCFGIGALATPLIVSFGVNVAALSGAAGALLMAVWALGVPAPTAPSERRAEQSTATRLILFSAAAFFVLYVGVEIGFAGWIHTYSGEIGFSSSHQTWVTSTFWISFTVGRLVSAVVTGRFRPKVIIVAAMVLAIVAAAVLVVANGSPSGVWIGTAAIGLATAPQFPVMMAYLERRVKLSGSDTSWFMTAAGVGGFAFPYVIGQFLDSIGTVMFPWVVLVLACATLGMFARVNSVLGG